MPDIKHNFLRGKMNKDHDERLVANGEYRDAMNIEISTSEGSDVGTVQNIIGNRVIGATFWQDNLDSDSRCVGGIADEKNNAVYYFVVNHGNEKITNTALTDGTNWTAGTGIVTDYTPSGVKIWSTPGASGQYQGLQTPFSLEDGKRYTVTCTFSEIQNDGDTHPDGMHAWVGGNDVASGSGTGNNMYRPSGYLGKVIGNNNPSLADGNEGTYSATFDFDRSLNNNSNDMRFYMEMTHGDVYNKVIRISNVSVMESNNSYILEYDTTKDNKPNINNINAHQVTPVFTDIGNQVLAFDINKHITGINIIDDMLFWTDDNSEPKKINIPRCKEGTNPNGLEATNLINPAQGYVTDNSNPYGTKPMIEEHITVIKKAPKGALKLENETIRNKDKTYTAWMAISNNGNNPNDLINSSKGQLHDFSFLRVGDTFRTNLRSLTGSVSTIQLEWKDGDEIVLKEYSSADVEPPIPIDEYRIKGTISNWNGNNFDTINPLINANGSFQLGSILSGPYNWIIDQ